MTSTKPSTKPVPSGARRRRRMPGQGRLLAAFGLLVVGAFLPWLQTAAGPVIGARGPGLWTFYVSMLALAGGIVRHRMLAAAQGAVVGVVAVALPVWQLLHALNVLGTTGWMPAAGAVLTIGGGGLALAGAWQLFRGEDAPSP